jgi:hypothetical protein
VGAGTSDRGHATAAAKALSAHDQPPATVTSVVLPTNLDRREFEFQYTTRLLSVCRWVHHGSPLIFNKETDCR